MVLHGGETLSLTLREGYRLLMSETKVLSKIFECARKESTGEIRQLRSEEFRDLQAKCSRYRPGVAQRVGRGIALLFHDRGTRRG